MRELLDIPSQRMIRILEILIENEDWTTFAKLGTEINTSERTVAKDIAMLKEKWTQHLNIAVSKKNGVKLQNQNIAGIGLVFTDIFNDSVALQWIKDLLFHPGNTIEFYEGRLFTSRSVLIRLLPKINKYLSAKDMEIQNKDSKYNFVGKDEHYLRDFSASFLLELYGLNLEKFDLDIELSVISDLIISIMKNNNDPKEFSLISKDDISIIYNMMFYIVSLVRENNGYNVYSPYPSQNEMSSENLTYLKQHFSNIYLENINPIHEYIKNKFNGWSSDKERTFITKEIDIFSEKFFSDISFFPDEGIKNAFHYITKSIYFYTKLRPFKTSDLFNRIYYFSLSISRENPVLYKAAENNLKLFSQRTEFDVSGNISEFLFWICLFCPEITQIKRHHKVILISDFGGLHANFLKKVISDFFNSKSFFLIEIDVATYPDILSNEELDNYDVLITTTPNMSIFHRKSVLIKDYPTSDDFCEIFKVLNNKSID